MRDEPIQLSDRRVPRHRVRAPGSLLSDPEVADVVYSFLRLPPGATRRTAIRLVRALDTGAETSTGS